MLVCFSADFAKGDTRVCARTLVDLHNAFPHQNHEVKGVFVYLSAEVFMVDGDWTAGLRCHFIKPAQSCCVSPCSSGFSQLILFILLRSGATKDTVYERRKGGEGLGSSLSFPSNPHHPHLPLSGKFNRLTLRI